MNSLRRCLAIARREWGEAFGSPIFYVVAALYHLITGTFFVQLLRDLTDNMADPYKRSAYSGELNLSQFVLTNVFDVANSLLLFIVPILTMRLIAEEKRNGLHELLNATPVGTWTQLLGKALGVYLTVVLLVASVVIYPLMAARLAAVEWGLVVAGLLGLALLGAGYVAFGLFASSLTDNPMIAAVISFSGLLGFSFLAYLGPDDSTGPAALLRAFSFSLRQQEFFSGVLRGQDVTYFLFFTGFFLFAAANVLESRRWRL